MELFPSESTPNRLPCDGAVNYHGPIFPVADSDRYFECLRRTIAWQHDEVIMFGKRIVTAREVAWYGDREFSYTYSGTTRSALPWTPELKELKTRVESVSGASFNSCLLNLYHDGSEGMGWHSDDEDTLVEKAAIASLSFGAERKFVLRHKRNREMKVSLVLEHGSLLVMRDETQQCWSHSLPKSKRVAGERINLTFRLMRIES